MKTTLGIFEIPILIILVWIFVSLLGIERESTVQTNYLETIHRQNHMMLMYKEYETNRDIIYTDSTNTYTMKSSILFPE